MQREAAKYRKGPGDAPGVEGLGRPGTRVGDGDRERKTGKLVSVQLLLYY